jgi:hypothetical protein
MASIVALRMATSILVYIPIATLWVGKLIIEVVVVLRVASPDVARLWPLVRLEIVIKEFFDFFETKPSINSPLWPRLSIVMGPHRLRPSPAIPG